MKIDILTLFPDQVENFTQYGIFRIAQEEGALDLGVYDLRQWTKGKHKAADDRPYGGGAGMVLMVEPIFNALEELRTKDAKVLITTPRGRKFDQTYAKELSINNNAHYIFLCGHYEGIDERVHMYLIDEEISVGDYVLSGGELPALTISDALIRLLPGVLGNTASSEDESFEQGILEYPQYTRPESFNGWDVPDILLSGHHEKIEKWRREAAKKVTREKRPDLLKLQ